MVMEAYIESAAAAEEKERAKKEDRALKRWAKLINGLRVKLRLQAEYGSGTQMHEHQENPLAQAGEEGGKSKGKKSAAALLADQAEADRKAWNKRVGSDDDDEDEDDMEEVDPQVTSTTGHSLKDVPQGETNGQDTTEMDSDAESIGSVAQKPTSDKIEEKANGIARPSQVKLTVGKSNSALSIGSRSSRHRKTSPPVPGESAAVSSGEELSAPPARGKRKRPSVGRPPARRSLRSRASKTDAQKQEEQEKRRRVRDALTSGSETDED